VGKVFIQKSEKAAALGILFSILTPNINWKRLILEAIPEIPNIARSQADFCEAR